MALLVSLATVPAAGRGQEAPAPAPVAPESRVERPLTAPEGPPLSGAALEERTEEVSSKLRCPVCQSMSVADSPSASALAMKEEIRDLLSEGYSAGQINGYFESTYGEFVLLDPKREGLNWLVWLAPAGGLLAGLAWILFVTRRRAATEDDGALDDYLERVRAEVGGKPS